MKNHIKLEFYSLPENVALARVVIASLVAQSEVTLNELEEIKVAVSEAVSNAIIHGYQNQNNQTVILEAYVKDNKLNIKIQDFGIGIENIEEAMKPAFTTDPERMGLGFAFMKSFMDEVEVVSQTEKGTKVILTKYIENFSTNALLAK